MSIDWRWWVCRLLGHRYVHVVGAPGKFCTRCLSATDFVTWQVAEELYGPFPRGESR